MFDVDGTLIVADGADWSGALPLPGAVELLQWLRDAGRPFVLFTNGSTRPPGDYAARLRRAGLPVDDWQVITTGVTAADIIAHEYPGQPALVLGAEGVRGPVEARGIPIVEPKDAERAAVVLVGWDRVLTYEQLEAACRAVWGGAELLVTSPAPVFVTKHGMRPGWSGSVAAAITLVTGKAPRVVGKPAREALYVVARLLGVEPSRLAMVGDDPDLELRMGHEAGCFTVLVRTGKSSESGAAAEKPETADVVLDGVHQLLPLLTGRGHPSP